MIVCTKCGTENPEGTRFCVKCGGYLDWSGVKVEERPASAVSASLKTPEVTVEPGGQAACEVEVHNDGRLVDDYRLKVSGPDASWCSVEPASLRLMPKTGAAARVLFRPPRAPDPAAGTTAFVVTVSSTVDQMVKSDVAGSLTINPFAAIAATLVPQTSEGFEFGEHSVTVENRANASNRVRLTAQDADNKLTYDIVPSDMTLAPGSAAKSRLAVRSSDPKEPRTGRRMQFQVLVEPASGAPVRLEGATAFLQRPQSWWRKWRLAIGAALALLVVTGGVALAGPPYPHWPLVPQTSPSLPSPSPGKPTVDRTFVSFGTVQVHGGSPAESITVTNTGGRKTTVTPSLNDSKNFSMQDLCSGSPLAPNNKCQVQIAFTPQSQGEKDAILSFTVDNDAERPSDVSLRGVGQGVAVLTCVPASLPINILTTYPNVTTSSNFTKCTNTGTGDLVITSVALDDTTSKFKIQSTDCPGRTLRPNDGCSIAVQFTTSTNGPTFSARILINDSLNQQMIVPVTGYRIVLNFTIPPIH